MRQLLSLLGAINGRPREKKKKMTLRRRLVQTVELRVRMDCERCEREVRKALSGMRGWSCVTLIPWPLRIRTKFSLLASIAPLTMTPLFCALMMSSLHCALCSLHSLSQSVMTIMSFQHKLFPAYLFFHCNNAAAYADT